MTTITISLPDTMAQTIDVASIKEGFATRSEYIRNLLRSHLNKTNDLTVFKKQPLDVVATKLEGSGKYTKKFINGVVDGLSKSSFYAN